MERKKTGVFSCQELKKAISDGLILATPPIEEAQIQPASIDLRLGPKAYRLVSSFLPGKDQKVMDRLGPRSRHRANLLMYEHNTADGMVLEKGSVYLIPLMEKLALPKNVHGKANPKSTTGRLDIFTRVITDCNPRFDEIPQGYEGGLFLEVMPRSFTVKVWQGISLVQLRLRTGDSSVTDRQLKKLHNEYSILCDGKGEDILPLFDNPYNESRGRIPDDRVRVSNGIFMSADLIGDKSGAIIGYKAKKNSHVIDLTKKNYYNTEDFWEPIYSNTNRDMLILEPEEFYILATKEKIRIPPGYAADMAPYEAGSGELRTHYAGFFDPGFGYGKGGEVMGTKAVLEVRAHDVPFMIAHGQTFCKLFFEKMREVPDKVYGPTIGSSYQYQTITLSKQFKKG
ncbi:MAG TPA: 2'-deoxycytidine 5'-triphosphate deaminase [Thermodesulfobacteriota bacterium]|nr:2'-deoxycytidine 5'-triphosphate deaminase [Thermodesulfobacteriota bacterium]